MKANGVKRTLSTIEEEQVHWHHNIWHLRSKFQAMASGCMVFLASGMKLAWCIYETPSGKFLENQQTNGIVFSWFVGVLLGALLAATFVQRVTKNAAYCLSGALLLVGGALLIVLPTNWWALLVACLCEGGAYGVAHVQSTVTAAEAAPSYARGLLLSLECVCVWVGVCVQLLYTRCWFASEPPDGHRLHVDQPHGIAVAMLGALAVMLALLYRGESPLLEQQRRNARRQQLPLRQESQLRELPTPDIDNTQILKRLISVQFADECSDDYELQQLLLYDAGLRPCGALGQRNVWPLLKILCLRGFVVMTMSLPLNRAFHTLSENAFHCDRSCLFVLPLCGLLGALLGASRIDVRGRRRGAVVSLLFAAVAFFIMGGVLRHGRTEPNGVSNALQLELIACLMLFCQFIVNAGLAPSSLAYSGEAFTPSVKALCVALLFAIEQLLQILLAALTFYVGVDYVAFFFTVGGLSLLLGLMTFCFMPETRQLTLLQCIQKFNKFP